ncbi:MAG: hypothetical protein ACK5RG_12935 [Cyclobacteriaceae bacterium]|nr:hypothetical protein [Flammeovirgaceae bacterium]
MKFFAILLFSFELLAPALLNSTIEFSASGASDKSHLSVAQTTINSLLFLEECNEEEREGKDALPLAIELYSAKYLSFANHSSRTYIPLHSRQNLFDTHPPLYQLNQVFLI